MRKIIMITGVLLMSVLCSCTTNWTDLILEKGFFGEYGPMGSKSGVQIYPAEKIIKFMIQGQYDIEIYGMAFDRVEADREQNTLSYFRKDNRLIITIKILNYEGKYGRTEMQIIDCGEWITGEVDYTTLTSQESNALFLCRSLYNNKDYIYKGCTIVR